MNLKILSFPLLVLVSPYAFAGYQVIGPIKAQDCYDLGIQICSIKTVTEVRKDGRRYELINYFEKVDEYNSSKGLCHIKTKSKGMGVFSWGVNSLKQPDFWGHDKDGKFGKIDADYIYFKCIKR